LPISLPRPWHIREPYFHPVCRLSWWNIKTGICMPRAQGLSVWNYENPPKGRNSG
jgi:hypothetical protein